ncbi:MAG: alcohol dehydrogenase catalytic domain-containing protein [Planctomycetota bacterium]|jgi:threonine dehydrogenase-like Zn-dependent dehydrogenase|nr:alcohol dehydrogenase catalytic domain-containing protein [Planctomycetota bacterium]
MKTMKGIAVLEVDRVEVVDDIPLPEPGDYEALAKIHSCGFCNGRDFQIINGLIEEKSGFAGFPTILGHEAAGEIVEIGRKVRYLKVGDRIINPMLRRNPGNGYHSTWGGMCEFGLVDDRQARQEDQVKPADSIFIKQGPFPPGLSFNDAGVLLSLSECNSAAHNFGVRPGHDVLVYGAGPMGIGIAMFMKRLGVSSLTQVDLFEDRLEMARRIAKSDRTINTGKLDLDQELAGQLFDRVVDAVGFSKLLVEGSGRLKPGGTVCSFGVLKVGDTVIDTALLKDNTALHMLNFPDGEYKIMRETAELIQLGAVKPADFYSHTVPFEEISQAMELVKSKKAFKVVLTF